MRTRKPEAGRVPYEDASSAALRSLRGHLELEEIEAALGSTGRRGSQSPAGGLPRRNGSS
jgi:hypothetical protein